MNIGPFFALHTIRLLLIACGNECMYVAAKPELGSIIYTKW